MLFDCYLQPEKYKVGKRNVVMESTEKRKKPEEIIPRPPVNHENSTPASDSREIITPGNSVCCSSSQAHQKSESGNQTVKTENSTTVGQKCKTSTADNPLPSSHSEMTKRNKSCQSRTRNVKGQIPRSRSSSKSRAPVQNNHLVTDFFPARRSTRVPAARLKRQKESSVQEEILTGEEKGMQVVTFDGKGRGVITTQMFQKDDFVVEYAGELLVSDVAKKREKCYEAVAGVGCYMYYFMFRNKQYCIDATEESGRLGRLINHSKTNANLYTKVVNVDGKPHLALMAARAILAGEELLYDYGDRSRTSIAAHPWLAV